MIGMRLVGWILRLLRAVALRREAQHPVAEGATGPKNILVLLVRFPDVEPSVPVGDLEEKYFTKLADYVNDVSYGRTSGLGETKGWYTLPNLVERYRISPRSEE